MIGERIAQMNRIPIKAKDAYGVSKPQIELKQSAAFHVPKNLLELG